MNMFKVMLIDEMPNSYASQWNKFDFEITNHVSDYQNAKRILHKQDFDLIIADIDVLKPNYENFMQWVKEKCDKTSLILVSQSTEYDTLRNAFINGAMDFIAKPIDNGQFNDVLKRTSIKLHEKKDDYNYKINPIISELLSKTGCNINSNRFVKQVAKFFSIYYGKTLKIDDIAQWFGYNKVYFGKIFKQNIGIPYHDFYTQIKIEYAKELIMSGNYKMYEIAEMLGFSSNDYFRRVFKNLTGKTPSEVKKYG